MVCHQVAAKVLRAVKADVADYSTALKLELRLDKRLARELYVWMTLDSPTVCPLLGYALVDRSPVLLSPWYDKGNLEVYLRQHSEANRKRMVSRHKYSLMMARRIKPKGRSFRLLRA